jgi:hypothetical protein
MTSVLQKMKNQLEMLNTLGIDLLLPLFLKNMDKNGFISLFIIMDLLRNLTQLTNTTKLMLQTTCTVGSILLHATLLARNQPWYMYTWDLKKLQLKYLIKLNPSNSFLNTLEST